MAEFTLSYTANKINEKLEKIDKLAEKSQIPTKTSNLTNDSGFITQSDVEEYAQPKGNYAFKEEIPTIPTNVSAFTNDVGYLTEHQSLDGLASEDYVDNKISTIPTPDVSGQIGSHNMSETAHGDIRELISGLTTRLNTIANSDDITLDQLSEIVAYIKANKNLIDGITTSKVNVSDIIDNLTTNVANKPLSAKMGVELKKLIDAIKIPTSLPASDVSAWAKASTKPTYTKSEVGLGNVDNVKQYSASNPPPYPVTKVNNKTGAVTLSASDVGALPNTTKIPTKVSDLTNDSGFITSVPDEIYVGNGEMPETATIQILMDGSDEEQALKDELKEYIDGEIEKVTPVKGVDYFDGEKGDSGKSAYSYAQDGGYTGTESEFAEDINPDNINANSITFISTELAKRGQLKPEFANDISECTDTSKLYVLPDGYIYAYIKKR